MRSGGSGLSIQTPPSSRIAEIESDSTDGDSEISRVIMVYFFLFRDGSNASIHFGSCQSFFTSSNSCEFNLKFDDRRQPFWIAGWINWVTVNPHASASMGASRAEYCFQARSRIVGFRASCSIWIYS